MAGSGFLVFDLENWCEFHRGYHGISKLHAIRLWEAMAVHANVGKLEDIRGVLHLRFTTAMLKECSTENAVTAFFRDLLQSNVWTDSVATADDPLTPTSIESDDYRSPSPPSFRCTPELSPVTPAAERALGFSVD